MSKLWLKKSYSIESFSAIKCFLIYLSFHIIRKIKKYREEGYDIIYLDETWINKNHACEGGWTHNKIGPTGVKILYNA